MQKTDSARVTIVNDVANFREPTLDKTVRAYADGDSAPLKQLLASAWADAQPRAEILQTALASAALLDAQDFAGNFSDRAMPCLATVILGDTQKWLRDAIDRALIRRSPIAETAIASKALRQLRHRFADVITHHPGPRCFEALSQRVQNWSRRLLSLTLQADEPDPYAFWPILERARLLLNGLAVQAVDEAWEAETMENVRIHLVNSPDQAPVPDAIWPPLQAWRDCVMHKLLPKTPDLTACQQRLGAREALVQPFFDEATGAPYALWLTRHTFEWRRFPAATAPANWDNAVFNPWEKWLDKENSRQFQKLFSELAKSGPVKAFLDTLTNWIETAGAEHLIALLPARLGQLPWEGWEPFCSNRLSLERPVSLLRWRTQPGPPLPAANAKPKGWSIFYDGDPHSLRFGHAEAQDSARVLKTRAWSNLNQLTGFDILGALSERPHPRLIFHGTYDDKGPRRSHIELRRHDGIDPTCTAQHAPVPQAGNAPRRTAVRLDAELPRRAQQLHRSVRLPDEFKRRGGARARLASAHRHRPGADCRRGKSGYRSAVECRPVGVIDFPSTAVRNSRAAAPSALDQNSVGRQGEIAGNVQRGSGATLADGMVGRGVSKFGFRRIKQTPDAVS